MAKSSRRGSPYVCHKTHYSLYEGGRDEGPFDEDGKHFLHRPSVCGRAQQASTMYTLNHKMIVVYPSPPGTCQMYVLAAAFTPSCSLC
eukprot:c31347_g1_i1 orf=238-501(-)